MSSPRLSDVMQPSVLTISFTATAAEAARLMEERDIGCLIVTDGGGVVGILTERDLLRKVMAQGREARHIRVSDIMTDDVLTASPATPLGRAVSLMAEKRIRRLPVVENGRLVGIVTATDILVELQRSMSESAGRAAREAAAGPAKPRSAPAGAGARASSQKARRWK